MKLKNVLIVVHDMEKAKRFYKEILGLHVILDGEENVILTEGLVLQEASVWRAAIGREVSLKHHSAELYFEEIDMDAFIQKLEQQKEPIQYVTPLTELPQGQKMVRFYDPDGNLIEVRTPHRGQLDIRPGMTKAQVKEVVAWTNERGEAFLHQWAGPFWEYPLTEEKMEKELENVYSIYHGGAFVGIIQEVQREEQDVRVGRFVLNPEETGRGIGTAAMRRFCEVLFEDPTITSITLNVVNTNEAGRRCYQKCGFEETGKVVKRGELYGIEMRKERV